MNGYYTYSLEEIAQRYDLTEHPLFGILEHFGESEDYWIAGGAARAFMLNQPITTDVDFFFKTQEAFDQFVARFGSDESKQLASTAHHNTFKVAVGETTYKVQAIKIGYYAAIEECLESFDFTICRSRSRGIGCRRCYVGGFGLIV
jgi:hypothetical protein